MGYDTKFEGEFRLDRPLAAEHSAILQRFADESHNDTDYPGIWCQWVPSADGQALVWDQGEKFYDYVDWLKYLLTHYLIPWGYVLNGEVLWNGEAPGDIGKITVTKTAVRSQEGRIVFD